MVAILGVLAAVGIVAFGGFLGNAKVNASKTNHSNATSFIQTSLTKCSLGDTTIALKAANGSATTLACSSVTGGDASTVLLLLLIILRRRLEKSIQYSL